MKRETSVFMRDTIRDYLGRWATRPPLNPPRPLGIPPTTPQTEGP